MVTVPNDYSLLLTKADVLLQNEKCHLLVENETLKLKHLDEQNNQLLKEWRDQLRPRKKVLVEKFIDLFMYSFQISYGRLWF